MRTAFGRLVQELRLSKSLGQKEFSELLGMSLSHVSNLEHGRTNISDSVVGSYIKVLNCSGDEAHELRKLAKFSNSSRKNSDPSSPTARIQVMFAEFGDRLSPSARAAIQSIIERETGEELDALFFSSNKRAAAKQAAAKRPRRPSLPPSRVVEIALLAEEVRGVVCADTEKLDIGTAVERLSLTERDLSYDVREVLPSVFDGAFAVIVGHSHGHTLLVEESRFLSALNGVYFARHAIAHELGHHFLHQRLLASEKELFLPPQELAKNTPASSGSDGRIEQVVDSIVEVEAECFATFLLVPWVAFLKGTETRYLASDFGEQPVEVERYVKYFRIESFVDEFRAALWRKGITRHIAFGNAT